MQWDYLTESRKDGIVKDDIAGQTLSPTHIQNSIFKYKDDVTITVSTKPIVNIKELMDLYSIRTFSVPW